MKDELKFMGRIVLLLFIYAPIAIANQSENDCSASDYQSKTGWTFLSKRNKTPIQISRPDGFVAPDGQISPEEDFANNVEYFLFENEKLKSLTPEAHAWISKRFGSAFKLNRSDI